MKICIDCKLEKEFNFFHKDVSRRDGLLPYCKSCKNATQAEYNERNREKINAKQVRRRADNLEIYRARGRAASMKSRYNITEADKLKMLLSQGGKCLICARSSEQFKKGLCVDHCHATGAIRGLLCSQCNRVLGMF